MKFLKKGYSTFAIIFLLGISSILASWNTIDPDPKRKVSPNAYMRWVDDPNSGLQQSQTRSVYDIILKYLPSSYVILKQNRKNPLSREQFDEKFNEVEDIEYFNLFISLNDGRLNFVKTVCDQEEMDSQHLVRYLAYDIQSSTKLVHQGDTLDCSFIHFEETYEATPYARLFLAFDTSQSKSGRRESRTILTKLPWLDDPNVSFTISGEAIAAVPKLTFK